MADRPNLSPAVTLRKATPDDAPALRALRLEALTTSPRAFGADPEHASARTDDDWRQQLADLIEGDKGGTWVAEADGAIVGNATITRGHWVKTRHEGYVVGMYVAPAWRNQHLAERLLEAIAAWSQTHGVTVLKLGVSVDNTPAIRCYARCGYQVYGVDPRPICVDGEYIDELLMYRLLDTRHGEGNTP